jgi:quercetin dioxygenase-like cupin family protein
MSLEKNPTTGNILELFGPTVEFLTSPQEAQSDFCVLKGTIPPGVSVPLHSHADTDGEIEGLRQDSEGYKWIGAKTGDYIHVPSNARHAWRNVSNKPTLVYIITTKNMGHFFQETGRLETNTSQPVTSEDLAYFAEISTRYGYWNASSEENASVGIRMSF